MDTDLFETHQRLCVIRQHYLAVLNTYDQNFVCDVIFLLERGRTLTQRQQDHCALICNRIMRLQEVHERDQ